MAQALLVMDLQNGIVERMSEQADVLIDTIERVIDAARRHDVPVIFVRVAFRPGAPEVSRRNQSFATIKASTPMVETEPATQIHPRLQLREGDVLVTKRRVSAFTGSDLDVVLRSLEVDHLVLTGIATSGVVLSTTRQAADLDYQLTVISDACADADPEVHRVLTEKVFPRQAAVVNADQWIGDL
ncbi:MAG: cysteine hydrolase [Acidimicrobiaceae bacterium]|nr:cysteine hydrolase [Acidimicrobiaceae bacterium]